MKTLVPSVKYVNIKQWPLSSPPFTPAKAFEGNRFHFFYVLSPTEFSESLTTSDLLKLLQNNLSNGGIHKLAEVAWQRALRLSEKKLSHRSCKLIGWLRN